METAEIGGLKVRFEIRGPEGGKPVVLMHGWGCNLTTVRSIAAALEDGMRVISIDLPGHGETSEPPAVWGTRDFADFLDKVITRLGLSNPSLIGHSFGGRVAIQYASGHPVCKLMLVDAAGIKPRRGLSYYYKVYSYKLLKKLILALAGKEKGTRIIEKMLRKRGSADYQNSSPMMRAVMSKCVNEDLRKLMPSVKAPTLLVWGEDDTATPLSDAKIMERLIPDAGLVNFPGCGHYSFLDNPHGFKAVAREFFKNEMKR